MTLAVVVILVIWIVFIYNNLVALRNNRENAFANIDVQLKQRYDLIPQLVETVKGYAKHERELLEKGDAGPHGRYVGYHHKRQDRGRQCAFIGSGRA